MTKQQRLFVEMLCAAGARGVHTFEMRAAYIGNPSQRRAELEALGYVLRVGPRERLNGDALGVRYFLVSEPSAVSSASTPTAPASYPAGAHDGTPESSPPERDPSGVDADKTADTPQLFDTTSQEFDAMVPPLSPYDQEAA